MEENGCRFANSAPVGLPAVLYIGVKDEGEIETPQRNLDEVQKKFNTQINGFNVVIGSAIQINFLPQLAEHSAGRSCSVSIAGAAHHRLREPSASE